MRSHNCSPLAERVLHDIAIYRQPDGRYRLTLKKRLKKRLQKNWKKQLNWILREAKKLSIFQVVLKRNEIAPDQEKEIDLLVKRLPGQDDVVDSIAIFWGLSMRKGGNTIVRKLELGKSGISFSLKNKKAIAWLKNKKIIETAIPGSPKWTKAANELRLSNYKGNIHATTKTKIKDILVKAASEGWSYQKTSKLIQEAGEKGVFSQMRGEIIAVRELSVAYEEGKSIPLHDFKDKFTDRQVLKKFQTVNDSRVTKTHKQNQDDGWIKLDKTFSGTGDDKAPGSDNIRCRCATLYRVPELKK